MVQKELQGITPKILFPRDIRRASFHRKGFYHPGDVLRVMTNTDDIINVHLLPGITRIDQEVGMVEKVDPNGIEIQVMRNVLFGQEVVVVTHLRRRSQ